MIAKISLVVCWLLFVAVFFYVTLTGNAVSDYVFQVLCLMFMTNALTWFMSKENN